MATDMEMAIDSELILLARRPTHPGEVVREEFMPGYGLGVADLAARLLVSRQSVNELVRGRRSVSTDMALRLARLFGTTPQYWLNLQRNVDLWDTLNANPGALGGIEPLAAREA